MAIVIACPSCCEENTLNRRFDAWARFQIVGVDVKNELIVEDDFDTQVFDDNEIECSSCGETFGEDEIIQHLSSVDTEDEDQTKSSSPPA